MKQKFNLSQLLRKNIQSIKPYSTARDEYTGVALVNLDANENPYGSIGGENRNRYPDPYQTPLKELVASIKGIDSSRIFLGNGSDEAIDLLYTAFCNPGVDNAIICPPTYGMYKVSADINDVKCIEVSLTSDFQLDVNGILNAVTQQTKLIWICSPNNPSGNLLNRQAIYEIIETFDGIVVIDEAYIDFSPEPSWTKELEHFPNLVVLQTFSKAWGLANIRLGMMVASSEIIAVINKIKLPYNLSGLVQDFACDLLKNHVADKDAMVQDILKERNRLMKELPNISGVKAVYPTDANFILMKIDNAFAVYHYLVAEGIIVRDRSKIALCENSLRITIGTEAENTLLLEKLSTFLR